VPSNSVRTMVIFSIIAVVLAGAAIGGVRLLKARNSSYATNTHVAEAPAQPQQSQPESQKQNTSNDQKSTTTDTSSQQKATTPTTTTDTTKKDDAKPSATPTPTPAQPTNTNLPNTSAGFGDVGLTAIMMALAAFFASRILRARADYRRSLGL
jgi:cytoskeletal protein RodZ